MGVWEQYNTEFNNSSPIYSQIITLLSRSFARGEIKPGERIPSIREMALQLRVNANTMQRVYQEMERGGLIAAKRGTGYFFTEDYVMVEQISNSMAGEAIGRFLEEMRALGFSDRQIISELESRMEGANKAEAASKKAAGSESVASSKMEGVIAGGGRAEAASKTAGGGRAEAASGMVGGSRAEVASGMAAGSESVASSKMEGVIAGGGRAEAASKTAGGGRAEAASKTAAGSESEAASKMAAGSESVAASKMVGASGSKGGTGDGAVGG